MVWDWKEFLVASGDMLNVSMSFTSQYVNTTTKRFDKHEVVFVSGWNKTGDSSATEKTTIWMKINGLLLIHSVSSSTPQLLTLHRAWSNGQLIRCHPPMPMQFSYTHSYIQLIPYLYHHRYPLPLPQIRCLSININPAAVPPAQTLPASQPVVVCRMKLSRMLIRENRESLTPRKLKRMR